MLLSFILFRLRSGLEKCKHHRIYTKLDASEMSILVYDNNAECIAIISKSGTEFFRELSTYKLNKIAIIANDFENEVIKLKFTNKI